MSSSLRPSYPLRRSSSRMIAGVCAGISEYLGINVVFTRVIFVLMGLANGIGVLLYLLLLLIPAEDRATPPTAPTWSGPQYAPTPYVGRQPKPGKTIFGYIIGLVGLVASFITATTTFMSNINTITAFVGSLIGPSGPPPVYTPLPRPTEQQGFLPPNIDPPTPQLVDQLGVVFQIRDELGENQIAETVVVNINGETVGTLSIDADHPSATLRIQAPQAGQYRYMIAARTVFNLNGEQCETTSSGSGQIDVRSNVTFRLAGDITGCTVNALSLEE